MSTYLAITLRFLDSQPTFHGRGDGGEPEWPPSPLRLFQALVDAAASRWRAHRFDDYAKPFLTWLEKLALPVIIAPVPHVGVPFRIAVPNNDLDVWAGPVSKGLQPKKQPNELKTMKTVRTTRLVPTSGDAVHYLYPIADADEFARHRETLTAAARSITHLGWGVDMVAGNASEVSEEDAAKFAGERWRPAEGAATTSLRVPRAGTLEKLMEKHAAFLGRLSNDGFKPVPPLTAFDTIGYRRDTETASRPFAAFEIHRTIAELAELPAGASRFRPFDPVRTPGFARTSGSHDPCGAVVVAGMVRHATAAVARISQWVDESRIVSFIEGHGDKKDGQATTDDRLMFLPLPTITPLKVESIRRVLIVGPPGQDLTRVRQLLNGRELVSEPHFEAVAMLAVSSQRDETVRRYTASSCRWSTVTPVVLPGYDDPDGVRRRLSERTPARPMLAAEKQRQLEGLNRRVRDLLLRAFEHTGIGPGLLSIEKLESGEAELEWCDVGFRAGVDLARRYNLNTPQYPRYHVRVRFVHPVCGPLAVGAGRYRGLGLFATE